MFLFPLCLLKPWEISFLLFSPLLALVPLSSSLSHHSRRRLTVYRCITHIHLSNLQPCLPSSPREGAADQEKGKDSWKEGGSEREVFLCPKGLVSVCLNQEVWMWRQERQSRDILSVCVCVCVHLVELRCHICEDHSFTLVATRDDALNHWNARDNCCDMGRVCVCLCTWMSFGTFDGD